MACIAWHWEAISHRLNEWARGSPHSQSGLTTAHGDKLFIYPSFLTIFYLSPSRVSSLPSTFWDSRMNFLHSVAAVLLQEHSLPTEFPAISSFHTPSEHPFPNKFPAISSPSILLREYSFDKFSALSLFHPPSGTFTRRQIFYPFLSSFRRLSDKFPTLPCYRPLSGIFRRVTCSFSFSPSSYSPLGQWRCFPSLASTPTCHSLSPWRRTR